MTIEEIDREIARLVAENYNYECQAFFKMGVCATVAILICLYKLLK